MLPGSPRLLRLIRPILSPTTCFYNLPCPLIPLFLTSQRLTNECHPSVELIISNIAIGPHRQRQAASNKPEDHSQTPGPMARLVSKARLIKQGAIMSKGQTRQARAGVEKQGPTWTSNCLTGERRRPPSPAPNNVSPHRRFHALSSGSSMSRRWHSSPCRRASVHAHTGNSFRARAVPLTGQDLDREVPR